MNSPHGFNLTKHAYMRLIERFPKVAEQIAILGGSGKLKLAYAYLRNAWEVKGFFDGDNMRYFSDRYGNDQYTIFVNDNIVFVGITNESGSHIVTVVEDKRCNRRIVYEHKQ